MCMAIKLQAIENTVVHEYFLLQIIICKQNSRVI